MSKKLKTTPKEELSKGFLLKDTSNNEWEIQNIIGSGGFGYVYSGKIFMYSFLIILLGISFFPIEIFYQTELVVDGFVYSVWTIKFNFELTRNQF